MDRRRWIALLVPTGVSLGVHLGLLAVVAVVSITAVRLALPDDPRRDVVVMIESPASSQEPPEASRPGVPASASVALAVAPTLSGAGQGPLVAPPIASAIPPPALPPAGAPAIDMRRAVGPGAAFAGLSASRVRRIVYVVDISGPMTSSLSFVLDEVRRSVARLEPSQFFQVVLFSQDLAGPGLPGSMSLRGDRGALLPASPANRAMLAEFLEGVRPGGRSNPLAGLRTALGWKPDVVFLLARGIARTGPDARWGEGVGTILARLEELNPADESGRRPTAIKTIQFVDDDPTGLMQAIAAAHGNTPDDPASSYSRRNVEDLRDAGDGPAAGLAAVLDPRVDRAAALLGEVSSSRVDLRVVFGIAAPAEVAQVRDAASRALAMLEGAPAEDELARLTIGRALVLRAATEPGARGDLLDRAVETLDTGQGAPAEVLGTAALARALRRSAGDVVEAQSLAARVRDVAPGTLGALEAHLAAILAVADDPARAEAWVRDLEALGDRPPLVHAGRLDAGLLLLCLEAAARARLTHATTPEQVEATLDPHRRLWTQARPGLPGEAALASAGAVLGDHPLLDRLPAELALARGLALLPAPGAPPSPPCLRALDLAAERAMLGLGPGPSPISPPGTPAWTAELAMIRGAMSVSLAAGQAAPGEEAARRDAVARLDRCLAAFPGRSWRREAALHLVAHTGVLIGTHPSDDTLARPRVRALEALVVEDPRPEDGARLDAWRLELAQRLAILDPGDGALERRGLELIEGPWISEPEQDTDRLASWIHARRVARHMRTLAAAQRAGDPRAIREAAQPAVESARAGITRADRVAPEAADALRADLAEALIALESPEASEVYADLRARGVVLGGSARTATLGQARALRAQGDDAGAFAVLRDLTGQMPAPPPEPAEREVFWGAWTLATEILAERSALAGDEQARRTGAAHLLRLHALDPDLGGAGWRSRLQSTALSLGVTFPAMERDPAVHSAP